MRVLREPAGTSVEQVGPACNPKCSRLQPLSAGGCNPKCWRLQPDDTEAATLCSSLEQVVLADSGYVVLTGAAGCRLHLFTLNGALVWSASIDAGVSALTLSPCGGVLLCGYDDGALFACTLAL